GLAAEARQRQPISDDEIAEMAIAHFNIHGAERCARELRRWRPRQVSFRAGRILAARFIDRGRYQDLNDLALAAGNDLGCLLALALELRRVHRNLPKAAAIRALRLV